MSEINALAFRKATKERHVGRAKAERISEILADPPEELTEASLAAARRNTFQAPLSREMTAISGIRHSQSGAWGKSKYLVPFVRTPWNIMKFAVERSPLPFLKIAKDIARSKRGVGPPIDKAAQADIAGKAAWGTILGSWAYYMASQGKLTGGGPKEPAARDSSYNTGWLPYAIVINNKYYSYGRMEPLGSILGIAGDLFEGKDVMAEKEKQALTDRMIRSIMTNLASKTFLRGVSDVLAVMNDPERHSKRWLNSLGSTFVIPRIVSTTARATDQYLRRADTFPEYLQSQVPIWSRQLYPRRNRWGQRVERPGSPQQRMFSPIIVSESRGTEADREIIRLNARLGRVRKFHKGVELNPEEYDTLTFFAGRMAEERVLRFINSDFEELSKDDGAREILEKVGQSDSYIEIEDDFLKREMIEGFYSSAVSSARRRLFGVSRGDSPKGRNVPIAVTHKSLYDEVREEIGKLERD